MMNNATTTELIVRYFAAADDSDEEVFLYDELLDRAFRCPEDATEIVYELGWDLDSLLAD